MLTSLIVGVCWLLFPWTSSRVQVQRDHYSGQNLSVTFSSLCKACFVWVVFFSFFFFLLYFFILILFLIILYLQSVLPFFVATKMTRIRKPTLDKPTPERYVAAELTTVGLQDQTNGYFPHAVMVSAQLFKHLWPLNLWRHVWAIKMYKLHYIFWIISKVFLVTWILFWFFFSWFPPMFQKYAGWIWEVITFWLVNTSLRGGLRVKTWF